MKSHLTFWATRSVLIFINPVFFVALTATGMNYLWAQVTVVVANTIVNYYMGDKLVFKSYKTEGNASA
jgi:putative flippase GtrA